MPGYHVSQGRVFFDSGGGQEREEGYSMRRCARRLARPLGRAASVWLLLACLGSPLLAANVVHRDIPTGIRALNSNATSTHFMRHMWITSDGFIALVVQQGGLDGHYLVLYESRDGGLTWQPVLDIAPDASLISDGLMDSHDNILLVTSAMSDDTLDNAESSDVRFVAVLRDQLSGQWSIGTDNLIFEHDASSFGTRATIARSPQGTLGCAMRVGDSAARTWYIGLFHSQDGGTTWTRSPETLGTINKQAQKNPRLLWLGDDPAVVYQDAQMIGTQLRRYKRFAIKTSASPTWQISDVALMESNAADPLGTHWSAAVDSGNKIHVSYEDGPDGHGIKYAQFDYGTRKWKAPFVIATRGTYSNVSVSGNGVVTFVRDDEQETGKRLLGRTVQDTKWRSISAETWWGRMRLSSPERYGNYLPVLHSTSDGGTQHLIYNLLAVDEP